MGEANELRLPISVSHLIRGELLVHVAEIDELSLKLRSSFQVCDSSSLPPSMPATAAGSYSQISKVNSSSSSKGSIDTVKIRHLKIIYEAKAFTSIESSEIFTKDTIPATATDDHNGKD